MQKKLANKIILVTGASQGLGLAAAQTYAEHGATVILLAKNTKRLEIAYDSIVALGAPQPAAMPLDLASAVDADFEQLVHLIFQNFGRLDGILHSAAPLPNPSPLEGQDLNLWLQNMRVNVIAAARLTALCLPLLKKSAAATVLYTGSSAGLQPTAYWGAHAVSKAALLSLVQITADEWENVYPHLRVNLLIPHAVHTTSRMKSHPGEDKRLLPQLADLMPCYLNAMLEHAAYKSGEVIACQSAAAT